MKYLVLLGRFLFSILFILGSFGHFAPKDIAFAASQGLPMASLLVPLSGIICLAGGLSILLGYRARWGAWLLVIFLVPVTFTMHNFWAFKDPVMVGMQQAMFMKNLALVGAALLIAHFGSGPMSLKK